MILIDLHTHSTCSDGTLKPEALVRAAKARKVSVLSLTDHDTTEGVPEFLSACRHTGVRGLSGIELSADAPYTLHILGYNIVPGNGPLEKRLEMLREHRKDRNVAICQRLRELGLDVALEEVEAEAKGDVIARPHIARVLIRKGYVQDMAGAFRNYLADGAAAYIPRTRLSSGECIALIRQSRGVAVLAHPGQMGLEEPDLKKVLGELKEMGLWGLECLSSHHRYEEIYRYLKLASAIGLYTTAGTDFHGWNRPGVQMGIPVSEDFLPWARLQVPL